MKRDRAIALALLALLVAATLAVIITLAPTHQTVRYINYIASHQQP